MAKQTYTILWTPEGKEASPIDPWGEPGAYTSVLVDGDPPRPLFLPRHLDRLEESARLLGLVSPLSRGFVEEKVYEAVSHLEGGTMLRVALVPQGLSLATYPQSGKNGGLVGILETVGRHKPEAKSLQDIPLHQKVKVLDRNKEELLLVDDEGYLLEGSTTNLLFVRGKEVLTPESDCLPGITRQVLRERIPMPPWQWCPARIHSGQISEFEEILLCGSGKEVARLVGIESLDWKPDGDLAFQELARIFSEAKEDPEA